ncbi:hypothetical protein TSUD_384040 [Trifolium subterraneum]|uniref:LOB domain-containing protein n=1 Tax=Trifolium subterraneum TaxID=3900 RepID=A0A2Z6MTW1_TRISU|nr:hypothetical protein TSUD_384040 [Trifolium subterraneum]
MKSSCSGCRVLRKGCSENCIIKPCLEWIRCPEAQGNVTLFLAKFYGRTGLLNLLANATNKNSIARGTNMEIKEKTQFKRVGSTFKPKSQVGFVDNTTLLKSILEKEPNGATETQVNLELTLGINFQSNNGKNSYDN